MDWTEVVREAVSYVEKHITEDINMYDVADHVHVSPFYFHKGFGILCGYSITEYIRNRRLALVGQELLAEDVTVMELAMKYGYDSPDSFTKAFTRFDGYPLSVVRRDKTMLKAFAPLKLTTLYKSIQEKQLSNLTNNAALENRRRFTMRLLLVSVARGNMFPTSPALSHEWERAGELG